MAQHFILAQKVWQAVCMSLDQNTAQFLCQNISAEELPSLYVTWLLYSQHLAIVLSDLYVSLVLSDLEIMNWTLYSVHRDTMFSFHFPSLGDISYQFSIVCSPLCYLSVSSTEPGYTIFLHYLTQGLNLWLPGNHIGFNALIHSMNLLNNPIV